MAPQPQCSRAAARRTAVAAAGARTDVDRNLRVRSDYGILLTAAGIQDLPVSQDLVDFSADGLLRAVNVRRCTP
eukprot:SAG31_NODE_638_length_13329_cov_13.538095_3_plen_74_part_00